MGDSGPARYNGSTLHPHRGELHRGSADSADQHPRSSGIATAVQADVTPVPLKARLSKISTGT